MPFRLAALKRRDGLSKDTLVRLGPEWIGVLRHNLKRKTASNHRLSQKQANRAGHIKSGVGEQLIRFLSEV